MSNAKIETAQPVPYAPPSEYVNMENPTIDENIVVSQPMMNNVRLEKGENASINENVLLKQPILNTGNINEMLADEEARKEQTRRRNCCFACADSYGDNDVFCWSFFCKILCNGCGYCCLCCAECCRRNWCCSCEMVDASCDCGGRHCGCGF